jgi:hypothetical protein
MIWGCEKCGWVQRNAGDLPVDGACPDCQAPIRKCEYAPPARTDHVERAYIERTARELWLLRSELAGRFVAVYLMQSAPGSMMPDKDLVISCVELAERIISAAK